MELGIDSMAQNPADAAPKRKRKLNTTSVATSISNAHLGLSALSQKSEAGTSSPFEYNVASSSFSERNTDDLSNLLFPHFEVATKDNLWSSDYWAPLSDWSQVARPDVESPGSITTSSSSEQLSSTRSTGSHVDMASSLPRLEEMCDGITQAIGGLRERSSSPDAASQCSIAQLYDCSPRSSIVELLPAAYIWMNCYWIGTDIELVDGYAVSSDLLLVTLSVS
jgi:hypothetical protein